MWYIRYGSRIVHGADVRPSKKWEKIRLHEWTGFWEGCCESQISDLMFCWRNFLELSSRTVTYNKKSFVKRTGQDYQLSNTLWSVLLFSGSCVYALFCLKKNWQCKNAIVRYISKLLIFFLFFLHKRINLEIWCYRSYKNGTRRFKKLHDAQ